MRAKKPLSLMHTVVGSHNRDRLHDDEHDTINELGGEISHDRFGLAHIECPATHSHAIQKWLRNTFNTASEIQATEPPDRYDRLYTEIGGEG